MTDENTAVGAEPANEPSLRDELSAAFTRMADEAGGADNGDQEQTQGSEPPADGGEQPSGEPELGPDGRPRDDKGRFAKKEDGSDDATGPQPDGDDTTKGKDGARAEGAEGDGEGEGEDGGEGPKYTGPPPGWSVAAKAAFDDLPDAVKESIAKREQEIDKGFSKLKDYKGVDRYVETAKQNGMSLADFMQKYEAAERFLIEKPVEGILWLCKTYGVDPGQLAGEGVRGAQHPQNGAGNGAQAPQGDDDPRTKALLQKIDGLEKRLSRVDTLEQTVYGDKRKQVDQQVATFFSDPKNKFAEDVADQMVVLINQAKQAGEQVDLASIYETACYMNPEVRAELIKQQTAAKRKADTDKARQAADQARQAGASIAGGPSATQPTASPEADDLRTQLEQNYAALARS